MQRYLTTNWRLKKTKDKNWMEAQVPGSVYTQLLEAGKISDPFWKDNEDSICALMEEDYEYQCCFDGAEEMDCEQVLLRLEGVDTLGEVYLNDHFIGSTENMHRIWEFEVKDFLKERDNILEIRLKSPLKYIAEADKKYHTHGNEDTFAGFMHLRKAHYMFGWDWGAHLPDAGIFRSVSLIGINTARIDSVYIRQVHQSGTVTLLPEILVNWAEEPWKEIAWKETSGKRKGGEEQKSEELSYTVAITAPDGSRQIFSHSPQRIEISNPKLWWSNGIGAQSLYEAEVTLEKDGMVLDRWKQRIGLRTMTMHQEKDSWGESFAHEVNGVQIFAMGADYIPEDHLIGRTNREKTRKLLEACKMANFNTVRVWGGGYYPEDWFFDLCDELGLMVWQDFMFACSVYELTEEFEQNITQEFIDNIKRIRNHASLALWCGNNEMEMFVQERCWVTKETEVRDYLFMYERIIPSILKKYDPDTFYWPASPSSGGSFDEPNSPDRGDVHYWKVWHGNRPFTEYRKYFFRYASEFGFQSFPSLKTIQTFTDDPVDWNPFSYIMEKHQRNYGANGKITSYLQQMYRYPNEFTLFLYASQLLQAEAIRYGVEHFRRNRGRCMGTIYWQLNDCWPVISWSSIDYCNRWKALHYYAKRFFAPLLISCEEQGMMAAEVNLNRQNPDYEKSFRLNIANETLNERKVEVRWQLRNQYAQVLEEHREELTVSAMSSTWLDKVLLEDMDVFTQYISFQLLEAGEEKSAGTALLTYPKYFRLEDPNLQCRVEHDTLVITADTYAKNVEIQNENEDMVLEDNYFDMNAGERRIGILSGVPEKIVVRSVWDIK